MNDAEQQAADCFERCARLESVIDDLTFQLEREKAAREQAEVMIRKLQSEKPPLTEDDWHRMVRGDE